MSKSTERYPENVYRLLGIDEYYYRHLSAEEHDELEKRIDMALSGLKREEIDIFKHYYQLKWTQEEIAKEYGMVKQRVSQINAKTLRKLKHPSRLNILIARDNHDNNDTFTLADSYEASKVLSVDSEKAYTLIAILLARCINESMDSRNLDNNYCNYKDVLSAFKFAKEAAKRAFLYEHEGATYSPASINETLQVFKEEDMARTIKPLEEEEIKEPLNSVTYPSMYMFCYNVDLSARAFNCMVRAGMDRPDMNVKEFYEEYILRDKDGDLVDSMTEAKIMTIRNLGHKSADEIRNKIETILKKKAKLCVTMEETE